MKAMKSVRKDIWQVLSITMSSFSQGLVIKIVSFAIFLSKYLLGTQHFLIFATSKRAESPQGQRGGRTHTYNKGVSCALVLTVLNFATSTVSQKTKQRGRLMGVSYIAIIGSWSVIHTAGKPRQWYSILYTYVGLSALLVSTYRAMRRPSECGTSDRTGSTFFVFV